MARRGEKLENGVDDLGKKNKRERAEGGEREEKRRAEFPLSFSLSLVSLLFLFSEKREEKRREAKRVKKERRERKGEKRAKRDLERE